MRLVSVWIEQYMSLENLGFNLGDEIHFDFEFDSKKRTLNVKAEKTKDYFNLFKDSKIKNITGIIGNNGVGKTSFLKLLNVCESNGPIVYSTLLIFKDDQSKKYIGYNYAHDFKAKQINVVIDSEFKKLIKPYNFEIINSDNPFKDCNILFYSNLYSEHNDLYLKKNNTLNRSVDYLTRKSLSRINIERYNKRYDKIPKKSMYRDAQYNILKIYFNERFKRLIKFLSIINIEHKELKKIIDNIPFPEYLSINFNEELFEQLNSSIETSKSDLKYLREVIQFLIENLKKEKDVNLRFKNEIILKYFLDRIKNLLLKPEQSDYLISDIELFINQLRIDETLYEKINDYMVGHVDKDLFFQIKKLNKILDYRSKKNNKVELQEEVITNLFGQYNYKIKVSNNIWEFVNAINELFETDNDPLVSFRWNPLSAGQEAILNQFVQLWEGINYSKTKNLLISIDEGELYLHPEWQRQYIDLIYSFVKYFTDLKDEIDSVQILLTSHSPFVVSDIPKFNLVFLKREDGNNIQKPIITIANSQNHQSTFGGNIFDLYKNSFFVKDFFGEYSIKWLNEALRQINHKDTNTKKSEFKIEGQKELQDFVQIIGEKVLKDVLLSQMQNNNQSQEYEVINLTERAKKKLDEYINENKKSK